LSHTGSLTFLGNFAAQFSGAPPDSDDYIAP
jgi:hypothetical protein